MTSFLMGKMLGSDENSLQIILAVSFDVKLEPSRPSTYTENLCERMESDGVFRSYRMVLECKSR